MERPEVTATFVTSTETGELVRRAWRLEVLEGANRGKALCRRAGTVLVGAKDDNDLVLSDPGVSRYHLELRLFPEAVELRDLDSKNGTRLGAVSIDRAFVGAGARIRLGRTVLGLEVEDEPTDVGEGLDRLGSFVTAAPAMRRVLAELELAAQSDATILLEGDTGTGKELLARAVHDASPRRDGPFVVFDCGTAQPALVSSQLFGHVAGAFTGAIADHAGVFERADGGTLFFDEVGELPLDLQPALLRAVETRSVTPVGGRAPARVDVRFVAATHRRLAERVQQKSFRADLFYRLAVVRARVPPLSERPEDVPLLARRFAEALGASAGSLTAEAMARLTAHDWPGNVRELRNAIERSVALARGGPLGVDHLFLEEDEAPRSFEEALAESERRYVRALLATHDGNVSQAARAAGLSRAGLYKIMKRTGLS